MQSFVSYTRLAVQRAEDMAPTVLEDGTTVSQTAATSESEHSPARESVKFYSHINGSSLMCCTVFPGSSSHALR